RGAKPFCGSAFQAMGINRFVHPDPPELISGWVIDKSKRVYLERTRRELQELYRDGKLKKPYELSALLPWMLAQDLNHHLAGHPEDRFVLFIDEYERVFNEGGAGARWRENRFDSHMRTL